MHVSLTNPENHISSPQKKSENSSRKRAENRGKKGEDNINNKINIAGFKPTSADLYFLKKQGYSIVSNPNNDYSILLVV
jgi:hypothetical protein